MTTLVLVSGAPATGKTTLARGLADALGWPLIEKDVIKEALHRVFPAFDVEASHRLGLATYEVMFDLAEAMPHAIFEANFDPTKTRERIDAIGAHALEIFCMCDPEIALARYRDRRRGPPHLDDVMLTEIERRLRGEQRPVLTGGPILEVNTGAPVNVDDVAGWVRAQL